MSSSAEISISSSSETSARYHSEGTQSSTVPLPHSTSSDSPRATISDSEPTAEPLPPRPFAVSMNYASEPRNAPPRMQPRLIEDTPPPPVPPPFLDIPVAAKESESSSASLNDDHIEPPSLTVPPSEKELHEDEDDTRSLSGFRSTEAEPRMTFQREHYVFGEPPQRQERPPSACCILL
jgi:hypothetical protein